MDLKNYTTVITNLSIIITFIYSIILIIDELYNIGLFSFKYTYLYNYGSIMSNFNNIQTIECETNRFNLYSNNTYIYKDIFSKSYFNYLIIIAITFITILFVLAYGINFYFTFIINQPEVCSFHKSTSFIKTILKCLCDTCHEFIPDCTGNYFITFILIIIIPLSYFLKSFLNIDITPNSTSFLFSFGYIILFIILLFTYAFILFNINKTDDNTTERLKDVGIYIIFTIIFILSGYIYTYIYKKYTDISLNKSKNPETFYDIYKQTPPIKPRPIQEPTYKGINLLNSFKYDPKNKDADYKQKKEIMDDYYISIRNYDKDMNYYTQKYNNYINSKNKLGDSTNLINISINILGLNNYIHLYVIGLLILTIGIYYFYNNDLLFICVIYLICVLTILTIINAIQYYNTILNKYIIYEPQSYYKNDITNTNTKLNLLLDPSNGDGFYNILTNNQIKSKNINISPETIIANIKTLTIFENFTTDNITIINNSCKDLMIPTTDNIIDPDTYKIYYSNGSNAIGSITKTEVKTNIIDKIQFFDFINLTDIFIYKYNPITFIDIYYNNDNYIRLTNFKYYNRYIYYYSYLFERLLLRLRIIYTDSIKKIDKYQNVFKNIQTNYFNYQLKPTEHGQLKTSIDNEMNTINSIDTPNYKSSKMLSDSFFTNIELFIKHHIISINKAKLVYIYDLLATSPAQGNYHFINKLNISANTLTFTYTESTRILTPLSNDASQYHQNNIIENNTNLTDKDKTFIDDISSKITADKIFKYENSNLYVLVPIKLIDNNYNEHYITSTASTPLTKISFTEKSLYPLIQAYPKIYNYNTTDIYRFQTLDNLNYTQTQTVSGVYTQPTIFKAPYKLKEYASTSANILNKFKQIILSALLNNLIHITSKYEYKDLKQKLYFKSGATSSDLNINIIDRVDYNAAFSSININTQNIATANFLDKTSGSYVAYIVLLYNIYTYDKDRIIDIIEYFIYNKGDYDAATYTEADGYLNKKILSLKTQIDKTVKKTDLIKLYENNRYIINLILRINENLIKFIKKEIETNIDISLCHSTNATATDIEIQLYNHIRTYFTISSSNTNIFTSVATTSLTDVKKNKIREIGQNITYFFNICIFLLNNIEANVKIQEDDKETIISNFKFYNMDDTINLDTSNLENVRKNLTINCDYYSKYNNLDKKQKLYMKTNADNVNYSFPILIIIFIAIFGETAFIKS